MKDTVIVRPEKCVACNVCVRCCPAPEANVVKTMDSGKRIIAVDAEKCIGCGECIRECPHGARDYVDDTEVMMSKINGEKMIILVDPSLKASYPTQWKSVLDWFKKKDCLIFDASYGADIFSWAMLSMIDSKKMGNMISPACAAAVNYVKLYQPGLMKNLAPIFSPAVCMAIYIKNYLRRTNRIVMLSSCIAKKMEFIDTGFIDYNVTFKKLMAYFSKNDIVIPTEIYSDLDYEFEDGREGQMGVACARPGGLKDNIMSKKPDAAITYVAGSKVLYPDLQLYAKMPDRKLPAVFDVLSCDYGCCLGPGVNKSQSTFEVMGSMNAVEADVAAKLSKNKGMFRSKDDIFKKFDEELELDDFFRSYRPQKPSPAPNLNDLEPIYESMGKKTDADKHFNCGACGYSTCHEMAVAIYRGINIKENCFVYEATKGGGVSEESIKECTDLSAKINESVEAITKSMESISATNDKNVEKTKAVNDLLRNVVAFCGKKNEMDEASISQMIKILETAIKSMGAYDENAGATKESAEAVSKSLKDIKAHMESLSAAINGKEAG